MIKQSAARRKKKKAVVWQTYCAFVLQGVEAPLHWRIIVWLSGFAHALWPMGRHAELYKSLWCILASLVTSPEKESGSRRLFFSTIFPEQLQIFCAWQEKSPLNQTGSGRMQFIPLFLYAFRWNIEVSYYEQKTFWPFCSYMVRSCKGIEMLVNLTNASVTFISWALMIVSFLHFGQ